MSREMYGGVNDFFRLTLGTKESMAARKVSFHLSQAKLTSHSLVTMSTNEILSRELTRPSKSPLGLPRKDLRMKFEF